MGITARERRESERQKFLAKCRHKMFVEHEETNKRLQLEESDAFLFELSDAILDTLRNILDNVEPREPHSHADTSAVRNAARKFWLDIYKEIKDFSRSDAERCELIAIFLVKEVIATFTISLHAIALQELQEKPHLILRAPYGDAVVHMATE